MSGHRPRTPAEAAGLDPMLLARLRPATEEQRLSEPRILLPTLAVEGCGGWLCKVCLRSIEPDRRPWSWFACRHCRAVDGRIAAVFGARRFLPLGQHSMMNGLGLSLDTVTDAAVVAFYDQSIAMIDGWQRLSSWREQQATELSHIVWAILGADLTEIPVSCWTQMLDPGPEASARDYHRMLRQQHRWLIDLDPRFDDVGWLAGAGQSSDPVT